LTAPALKWVPRPHDAVEVGRVLGAWGVRGGLKIQSYSASAEALFHAPSWLLQEGGSGADGPVLEAEVTDLRAHGHTLVAALDGVSGRDAAEALAQRVILIPRSAFPPLAESEYYWVDLIGLDVVNRTGEFLGQVADLMPTGSRQVLVVADRRSSDPRERLIPFVDVYVDAIDLAARRITVDWSRDY
jgi:16S rRNA processing protein RimM